MHNPQDELKRNERKGATVIVKQSQ